MPPAQAAAPARPACGDPELVSDEAEQRLFKTGGGLIRYARDFNLHLAESYLTRRLFGRILGRIERFV